MSAGVPAIEPPRTTLLRIGGYSFVILFLELALIRYVPGYVRMLGFFLNFVLMAAFLGMGVGLLRANDAQRLRWLVGPALLALVLAVAFLSTAGIQSPDSTVEHLWDQPSQGIPVPLVGAVVGLFGLCALVFIPLGALLGREFSKLPALPAYTANVGGSLLGILAFAVLSRFRAPPLFWFAIAVAALGPLGWRDRRFTATLVASAVAVLLVVGQTAQGVEVWSPYYRINVLPSQNVYQVNVNGAVHQYVINLDSSATGFRGDVRRDFLRPLSLLSRIDTALVLGSGTGNDVAILLQRGARYVDAVEIDPTILELGRALHFQRPYDDPRVHAYVQDGRAFLRNTRQRYDLIVIGTLDSHTLLSGMSSVRLDNFIFTAESFVSARDRLKPGGHLVTYHMAPWPEVVAKIYGLMEASFGSPPVVLHEPVARLFNYAFIAGADLPPDSLKPLPAELRGLELPRDDWPYLYLGHRTIPAHYLLGLAGVLLLSFWMAAWGGGSRLRSGFDGSMFLLGCGFLLLETKSVSEMSLLFGSTWTVNVLVFASILTMILLANAIVLRRGARPVRGLFVATLASLAVAYAVPVRNLLWLSLPAQWLLGGLLVALPLFFAGLTFATLMQGRGDAPRALAWNLVGAIVGGVLEYTSLVIGIKGLYLIAAVAYGLAWLSAEKRRESAAVAVSAG